MLLPQQAPFTTSYQQVKGHHLPPHTHCMFHTYVPPSMLLGLPKPQQRLLEELLSSNIQTELRLGEGLTAERLGEGLTAERVLATVKYIESLLENFPPGEAGLKLQLPLGIKS